MYKRTLQERAFKCHVRVVIENIESPLNRATRKKKKRRGKQKKEESWTRGASSLTSIDRLVCNVRRCGLVESTYGTHGRSGTRTEKGRGKGGRSDSETKPRRSAKTSATRMSKYVIYETLTHTYIHTHIHMKHRWHNQNEDRASANFSTYLVARNVQRFH